MFGNNMGYYPYEQSKGLLSGLKNKISFTAILDNTQRVLNIANQTIPIINQVKPMVSNAKTLFKIMGAVKADDAISNNSSKNTYNSKTKNNNTRIIHNKNESSNKEVYQKDNINNRNTPNFFL